MGSPEQKDEKRYTKDGILIPPGYSPLCEVCELKEVTDTEEVTGAVRIFNGRIVFTLDQSNPEYLALLKAHKRETRTLAIHLQNEMERRKLPVYTGKNPKGQEGKRTMIFLIRQPFFSSNEEDKQLKRIQPGDEKDYFVIHIDETGKIHEVRGFRTENDNWMNFRFQVITYLKDHRIAEELKKAYERRNWDEFAKIIADAIEESFISTSRNT